MALGVQFKDNGLPRDLQNLPKDLFTYISFRSLAAVKAALPELRTSLMSLISRLYDTKTSTVSTTETSTSTNAVTFPKLKTDIIKEVFGKDVNLQNPKNTNTKRDEVNVFVVRNKRIKAWQSVSDSSTYSTEEMKFKERLMQGIIINYDTGKMYSFDPETVKGIKVECSTDTGETINSSHKFEAYKNSDKITRTKSTFGRSVIWTVRQEDVAIMTSRAVSIDTIVQQIQDGRYQDAIETLNQVNRTGTYTQAIDNIKKVRTGKSTNVDLVVYRQLQKLVQNIQVKEMKTGSRTTIMLVTSYDDSIEDQAADFFLELRNLLYLWIVDNTDKWIKIIIDAIETVIKKYNKKG